MWVEKRLQARESQREIGKEEYEGVKVKGQRLVKIRQGAISRVVWPQDGVWKADIDRS